MSPTLPMRKESGTYALILRARDEHSIEVGALGQRAVQPGTYVYVGSAFGPGGVRARVHRHARHRGARHWHIDYLRAVTTLEAVWYTHDGRHRECDWASTLRMRATMELPIEGFGASDCGCSSHLLFGGERPRFIGFREHLHSKIPGHAPIFRVQAETLLAE